MIDDILQNCNETELLTLARRQGLGVLIRGLPRATLIGLVSGELDMSPEYLAGTRDTRAKLEKYIYNHYSVTRSQLPGCNGRCSTFNCSEGRHAVCYLPNVAAVQ